MATSTKKKTRLQWAEERQAQTVDDWMKVMFSHEAQIFTIRGDGAATFIQCFSNDTYRDDCLKKARKCPTSFMILGRIRDVRR